MMTPIPPGGPIRVLVVNPDFFRSSGVTVAIRRLYEATPKEAICFEFVSCQMSNDDDKSEDLSWLGNATPHRLGLMSRNPITLIVALLRLGQLLVSGRFQVLHVHHRRLAILCSWIARFLGVKVIYTGHLVYGHSPLFRLARIDYAIAITESVFVELRRDFPNLQIKVISNVVPLEERASINNHGPVLCIGRLDSVKNHKTLIHAWKQTSNRGDRKLRLIGEGPLLAELQTLTKELEIDNSVVFVGYSSQIIDEIQNSAFCVLASQVEGQGIVTLEAASVGRASLVSNVPGSRDCIPSKKLKLPNLFQANDVGELASMLECWLENPDAVQHDGNVMREFVRASASPQFVSSETITLYNEVLVGRKSSANFKTRRV